LFGGLSHFLLWPYGRRFSTLHTFTEDCDIAVEQRLNDEP
jgi:hypothetical protein